MKFTTPVFVLGGYYNGLKVIQMLGRKGIPVFAVDTHRSLGTYSRYANYAISPDPHCQEDDFINWLIDIIKIQPGHPLIIPTNDGWASAIAKNKEKLSAHCVPCVADETVVNLLLNKNLFYEWAEKKGYPVPKTYRASSFRSREPISFPIIAKPNFRRISSNSVENLVLQEKMDANRAMVLHSLQEYDSFCADNANLLDNLIFQEFVFGYSDSMYTIGLYADKKHQIQSLFTGHKVRGYPVDHGDCMVGESYQLSEELVELTKQLLLDLEYHGIAEVEFKKDARTGEFKLIEINPRTWSWIGIVEACKVNIPWMAYRDLILNEPISLEISSCKSSDIKFIRIFDDFMNCLNENKKAGYTDYHFSLLEWFGNIKAKQRVFAEFSYDDMVPFVLVSKKFIVHTLCRLFRKLRGMLHNATS